MKFSLYSKLVLVILTLYRRGKLLEHFISIAVAKRAEETYRSGSRREASNAKSRNSLFYFKPEKVNKFEYCNNLWKQNIFHNPVRKMNA